ncbi:MAG: tetratricopeptide repeat protein [Devosia nanyangense]|uniref:Tetratricopeptide repeat protein n=1 Tax=Devosia nanyangense TaxID=1228055 RepID=A0A933L5X6_9HYPH|nr:tetratricopeptide repeat protein [Devosia nanyangense]
MRRRTIGTLRWGVLAVAMAALPLAGCSSGYSGGASAFGNSKVEIAELKNAGSYTADSALAEARAHFRSSDYGYSAALYKVAVNLSPKNPEGYVGLAASYDRLRRFDLSDRVYESLFGLAGGTAQYYNNVGYSYLLRGNLAAAATNFRKALKLDPDNVVVANNLQIIANATAAARA